MSDVDYELDALLNLNGHRFNFDSGYWLKFEVQRVEATAGRPSGIKYSLTLHDPDGDRIYGMDNAHHGRDRRGAYDHRHVYGTDKTVAYAYQGATELLEAFYREVERILRERGVR